MTRGSARPAGPWGPGQTCPLPHGLWQWPAQVIRAGTQVAQVSLLLERVCFKGAWTLFSPSSLSLWSRIQAVHLLTHTCSQGRPLGRTHRPGPGSERKDKNHDASGMTSLLGGWVGPSSSLGRTQEMGFPSLPQQWFLGCSVASTSVLLVPNCPCPLEASVSVSVMPQTSAQDRTHCPEI